MKLMKEIEKTSEAKAGLSQIVEEALTEWYKVHANGNPQYPISAFNDPDFSAYPAFGSSHQRLREWFHSLKEKKMEDRINETRFKLQEWNCLFEWEFGKL